MSDRAPFDLSDLRGSDDSADSSGGGRSISASLVAVLLVVSLAGGAMAFETVGEGSVKVLKDQGAVTGDILEPGWHFIVPLVQSTKAVETRPQSYTMSSASGEGNQANRDDSVRVLTSDGLAVDVDTTIRYRITPADAPVFHGEYRDMDTAETRIIRPTIRSELRTEGGNIDVTEIYTGEGQTRLKLAVESALRDELQGSGISLETVQIRNVHLPSAYSQSIEQKKVREQAIEEAEYEIQVAQKNKERDIIAAEAEAEEIRIAGEALADNPEVIQLRYIDALKQNDNTIYVTGSNSEMVLTREVEENSDGDN